MQTVILLHGIWMKPIVMRYLAAKIRHVGYQTRCFSYPSLRQNPSQNADALHDYIQQIKTDEQIHFVAHSLGGIVLMHFLTRYAFEPGKIVMLGTPLNGSQAARRFNELPLSQLTLGKSVEQGLLGGMPAYQGGYQLGMIAGDQPLGVARLLGRVNEANDGAVLLSETMNPLLSDHLQMHVSHSGMLFSDAVARQVIHFLKNGRFAHTS